MRLTNIDFSLATRYLASTAVLLFASIAVVEAQVVLVPPQPQVGSSNPVTAEPHVPRPHTKPCVVPLFTNLEFADFNPKPYSYTPPAACPGPWSKVVFTADFTVTAGRQFDRTAAFYLGHANIYYGTTAEPRKTLSPSWHVERDVTDLTAIFKTAQTGQADLGNFVGVSGGVTYNGIIYADAALEFYPANWDDRAPRVPDIVVPVNGPGGDAGTINTATPQITQVLNLPTNVERVYLDVIAQSQNAEEQWFLCVPTAQATELITCGNTAFRETEVTIDGTPAGVAPVYPWIYTGGLDPYLWEPIPGVQTLDFKPYRVDLTPFAGLLSDGSLHTVAVGVFNAYSYFLATANVLAYTDHGSSKVTGGILSNTLAAPNPVVTDTISFNPTTMFYTGSVNVAFNRKFKIRGYVNTSHGRIETTVAQDVNFLSNQQFNVNSAGTVEIQNAQQTSTVDSRVTTRNGFFERSSEQHFSYPINVDYSYAANSDGTAQQTVTVNQKDFTRTAEKLGDFDLFHSDTANVVNATDTLNFTASGFTPSGAKTTQTYRECDSLGHCYSRKITAADQKLTSVKTGKDCDDDHHDHGDD